MTVIGIEKGSHTKEKVQRNFGAVNPEGYRKALRLMHQAEKFFTAGDLHCGYGGRPRAVSAPRNGGRARPFLKNLCEMMSLKVPIISLLIGEGGSGAGRWLFRWRTRFWCMENAIYSVIFS